MDELENRLKALTEALVQTTSYGYHPIRTTALLLDASLGGETVLHVVADVRTDEGARTLSGQLVLFSETFVAHAALTSVAHTRFRGPREGDVLVRTARRTNLRSVSLHAVDHPLGDAWSSDGAEIADEPIVTLGYEAFGEPLEFLVTYRNRDALLPLLYADLRS
jgi:hypothetical protein